MYISKRKIKQQEIKLQILMKHTPDLDTFQRIAQPTYLKWKELGGGIKWTPYKK